jgi:hypothetical protein
MKSGRQQAAFPPPMALGEPSSNGYFLIRVEGKDDYPRVQEVSAFLYDFNLVYEISRLAADPKYSGYRFSRSVWYRTRKPLVEQDRLHVDRFQLGSPLIFLVALAAAPVAVGAVWGIVQITGKIRDWRVDRETKRVDLEIKNLHRDNLILERETLALQLRQNELPPLPSPDSFAEILQSRGALRYYENSIKRLAENELQITELEVNIVPELPPKQKEP